MCILFWIFVSMLTSKYTLCSVILCAFCGMCVQGGLKCAEWRSISPLHLQGLYNGCKSTSFLLLLPIIVGEYVGPCLGLCTCGYSYKIACAGGLVASGHTSLEPVQSRQLDSPNPLLPSNP